MSAHQQNYLRQRLKREYRNHTGFCLSSKSQDQSQHFQSTAKNLSYSINQLESSPLFCTEEYNHHGYDQKFRINLNSQISEISSFGSSLVCFTEQSKQLQYEQSFSHQDSNLESQNDSHSSYSNLESQNDQRSSYAPSLQSYQHYHKQCDLTSSKSFYQTESGPQNLQSLHSDILPEGGSPKFTPSLTALNQHVNFIQNQLYQYQKKYLKMKSINQAIIMAMKNVFSENVGLELERYMQLDPQVGLKGESQGKISYQQLSQQYSKQFIQKMDSKSLEYSQQFDSRQMSKNFQDIFTLGGTKWFESLRINPLNSIINDSQCKISHKKYKGFKKIKQNKQNIDSSFLPVSGLKNKPKTDQKSNYSSINSQMTDFEINLALNPSKKSSLNVSQVEDQHLTSKKTGSRSCRSKKRDKSSNLQINKSLKQSYQDNISTNRSSNFHKKKNLQPQHSSIATQLLCQVCQQCLSPNQFFHHIDKCSSLSPNQKVSLKSAANPLKYVCSSQKSQTSFTSINSSQKLVFNYTLMMQNLFTMRSEIETQIQLLALSKKVSRQKSDKDKLKDKLEKDLQKVTKIIQIKQKEMELRVSKNLQEESKPNESRKSYQVLQKNTFHQQIRPINRLYELPKQTTKSTKYYKS